MKKIWITWENQRRNISLSSAVGAELFVFDYSKYTLFIRYGCCLYDTCRLLFAFKPDILFVQNPSIILALFTSLLRKSPFSHFKLVVDAHNAGIYPLEGKNWFLNKLRDIVIRNSDITIVTNNELAETVKKMCGVPVVVEDPLPVFDVYEKVKLEGKFNFLFICSYAEDEPYIEIIEAAKEIDPYICIYSTGKPPKELLHNSEKLPENFIMTGFLPAKKFDQMLFSVDAVIDLTKRENCLVCGAYEAVSAEKPLLLSKTKVLQEYFCQGCVYTDNSKDDIVNCIYDIIDKKEELKQEITCLKAILIRQYSERLFALDELLRLKMIRE